MNSYILLPDSTTELLTSWLYDITEVQQEYKEPILTEPVVKMIKVACDSFRQDVHVFIMSIEILESYIRMKNYLREVIPDEVLVLAASILMSSKCCGEQVNLKVKYIASFLLKVTGMHYHRKNIGSAEMDILRTLSGKLPITTIVDDLNTVVQLYMKELRLRADVRPMCIDLLQMVYLRRKSLLDAVQKVYEENPKSSSVWKMLMKNRCYLPIVILVTTFRLTNYKNMLDLASILKDVSEYAKIHEDHINILSDKLIAMLYE